MKTLYLDCFSGISGDMMLGALIDCGADKAELERQLALLPCRDEFELIVQKKTRFGITGTDVTVRLLHSMDHAHSPDSDHNGDPLDGDPLDHLHALDPQQEAHGHHSNHSHKEEVHAHPHLHTHTLQEKAAHHTHARTGYSAIAHLIEHSGISDGAKRKAKDMFACIAEAEARVHGTTVEEVHFHEVGAVDAIVDICGAAVALELLGVEQIICSPVNLGGGHVRCDHGLLPVPAPATALILEGVPVYGDDASCGELTTPTGAAIVKSLGATYGTMPAMTISSIGYGLGKRDTGRINALRVFLGETSASTKNEEQIVLLQANIDDMTGEALAFAAEQLRAAGALEVYFTPVLMKKGRPAQVLSVVCFPKDEVRFSDLILRHTSTLGVRVCAMKRRILSRSEGVAETSYGCIRFKEAADESGFLRRKAEFDDVAAAAKANDATLEAVYDSFRAVMNSDTGKR